MSVATLPFAGWPDVPFLLEPEILIGDAILWAECAHPRELWAYGLAILAKLPNAEREALLRALEALQL